MTTEIPQRINQQFEALRELERNIREQIGATDEIDTALEEVLFDNDASGRLQMNNAQERNLRKLQTKIKAARSTLFAVNQILGN